MSRKVISTNLRFNMNDPDEKRAWEYLQGLDRRQYKSYTKAVVLAVNAYFGRLERLENDPYLETRQKEDTFLQRVVEAINNGAREAMPTMAARALAQLLQASSTQLVPPFQQGKGLPYMSSDKVPVTSAATQDDADVALDFADGF